MLISCFLLISVVSLSAISAELPPHSKFCHDSQNRQNPKDLYGSPTNCHIYYQCFYSNDGSAYGIERRCAKGQYWDGTVLTCVAEDPNNPCKPGIADGSQSATTMRPPSLVADGSICRNGYNNYFKAGGTPSDYIVFDVPPDVIVDETKIDWFASQPQLNMLCPRGSIFSLTDCGCTVHTEQVPPAVSNKQCLLYLNFENQVFADSSIYNFQVSQYSEGVKIDSIGAHGSNGSASFAGGANDHLEIPGLKSIDIGNQASWCLFYKCGSRGCTSNGGLLSNNKDDQASEFTLMLTSLAGNRLQASINALAQSADPTTFTATGTGSSSTDFVQVCVVYDGTSLTLYVDNKVASTVPVPKTEGSAQLAIGHSPYSIGNDQKYGSFQGNIDDVLICQTALSASEVDAHWNGPDALRKASLIPKYAAKNKDDDECADTGFGGCCGWWNTLCCHDGCAWSRGCDGGRKC